MAIDFTTQNPQEGDTEDPGNGVTYVYTDGVWTATGSAAAGGGGEDLIPDFDTAGWPITHPGIPGYGAIGWGRVVSHNSGQGTNGAPSGDSHMQDVDWRMSPAWNDHLNYTGSLVGTDAGVVVGGGPIFLQCPNNFAGKSLILTADKASLAGGVYLYYHGSKGLDIGTQVDTSGSNGTVYLTYGPLPDGYVLTIKPSSGSTKLSILAYEIV